MKSFYTRQIEIDHRFNSPAQINDISLLEPIFRRQIINIVSKCKALGINLVVFETYRSQERQQALYEMGVTQLQKVGVHHFGLACDLVCFIGGQLSWNVDYRFLGDLAHSHQLIWGGDWGQPDKPNNFYDGAHLQRCSVSRQPELFSQSWYPDERYNPYED